MSIPANTDECGPDGLYCENRRFSQSSISKVFSSKSDQRAAARALATFQEDPGYYLGEYFDTGNGWGSSADVSYLDAYAQYNYGISAEEMVLSANAYLDPFEARTARMQYISGNKDEGDAILSAASIIPVVGGVYSLRNPMGIVVRVGMTKNFAMRERQYARYNNTFDLYFKPEYYTNDYATQRGLEQMLYDQYQPLLNVNRPIRIGNPNALRYLTAAGNYLSNLLGPK